MEDIRRCFIEAVQGCSRRDDPWRHWLLEDCLPPAVGEALANLPIPVPRIDDTRGKRETHNLLRQFFSVENRRRFPVMDQVARAFQSPEVVEALETLCGVDLSGNYLRIEYCQDTQGFWLEPHTDIGAKKFTMLIGLSKEPEAAAWGTSIYRDKETFVGNAPFGFDKGLIFIPGDDTWHGFVERPIQGVRRQIMLNYVIPEWRSRHELAFPDQPVS
ncbi:MAG: 2OG-Fe(II) oxygenase [Gammaproteobacteria bacterium]|nr:MAG: 2OG-Fe(II) oxygenase [Gammaproteobacteria bacterium]